MILRYYEKNLSHCHSFNHKFHMDRPWDGTRLNKVRGWRLSFSIETLLFYIWWAGQLSRYSDWLRAGWSGDRIPVEARFSAPVQTGPEDHPASCTMGTESFPGVKSGRGVTLTLHPLLVPLVTKEQSYTSTPPMGSTACTEPQCLYNGALYLLFYISTFGNLKNDEIIQYQCSVQST